MRGNYAASIRESIHAVEAAARVLEPGAQTLGPGLSKLEKSMRIHPALGKGFGSLYGFTNDEKGIRHALLDEPVAQVDETDALYMLGSCAAFVSYLINRARQAGLLQALQLARSPIFIRPGSSAPPSANKCSAAEPWRAP